MALIRFGSKTYGLPGGRLVRMGIGITFILMGVVGFLPVLGFWMVPLGLIVLSVDSARLRRLRRRVDVWWGKRRRNKAQVDSSKD